MIKELAYTILIFITFIIPAFELGVAIGKHGISYFFD